MLRRLALCFLVAPEQHKCSPIAVFNTDVKKQILSLSQRLRLAINYYASWKVVDKEETIANRQPLSKGSHGVDVALHCLERHLRASALIIKDFSGRPCDYGIQLKHERQAVATCWELLEAELKKLAAPQQPATSTVRDYLTLFVILYGILIFFWIERRPLKTMRLQHKLRKSLLRLIQYRYTGCGTLISKTKSWRPIFTMSWLSWRGKRRNHSSGRRGNSEEKWPPRPSDFTQNCSSFSSPKRPNGKNEKQRWWPFLERFLFRTFYLIKLNF